MHVGRRLAALRMDLGLSQEEMSKDLISRGHYSNIESGRYMVTEPFIDVLSSKLEIPKDYLLKTDQENQYLAELLGELEYCLELSEYEEAKWKIDSIKDVFPFINNIEQELRYFLLLTIYYILTQRIEDATKVIEKKIKVYVSFEEDVPADSQYLYFYALAIWYHSTNVLPISEEYYEKANLRATTMLQKAKVEYNRALCNYQLNKYQTAISYANCALDRYIEENMMRQVAQIYVFLSGIYWQLDMIEVSESVSMKGLEVSKQFGYIYLEEKLYHNLGLIYDKRNDLEKSKEFFGKSIAMKEKSKESSLVLSYINLLETLITNNRVDEAMELLKKVKNMDKTEKEKYTLLESEAKLYFLREEYEKYEALISKVIKYYKENNFHRFLVPISQKYSEYLASKNKYKDAYLYLKETLQAKEHLEENK